MEWTNITVKLLLFVRYLDHEKSQFFGGKYPFKSATVDDIYVYIKTTRENVKFHTLLEHTHTNKKRKSKKLDFFFSDEQAIV